MTQKELNYYEDAITHEESIINIIDALKESITEEDIRSFIDDEIKTHHQLKKKLLNRLEEVANEW